MGYRQRGFTLLEVSITIVIIGLIAGGIIGGQSLLKAAKIRKVSNDAYTYQVAIGQFKTRYGYLPGDIPNSQDLWGIPGGNANGVIDVVNCETYSAWKELAAAQLITGKYEGVSGLPDCAPNSIPGVNVPKGPLKDTGYSLISVEANDHKSLLDGSYINTMLFGHDVANTYTVGPALLASDAAGIDEKTDDGLPAEGKVRTFKQAAPVTPDCLNSPATYNKASVLPACMLIFMTGYSAK